MKYIVVCGDGMSDRPLAELGGKTPLEVADTPNMDSIAGRGEMGLLKTILEGLPKDSGVANLAILGYNPGEYYPGRGPLEAANMRIQLGEDDIAVRCNTITVEDGRVVDYSGGHISSKESHELIEFMNGKLGADEVTLHPGVAYRHVAVLRNHFSDKLVSRPPHDIIGKPIDENMIVPEDSEADDTAELLNKIMTESRNLLAEHPVNKKRVSAGKAPANMLWFWGAGKKPVMPSFKELFGLTGAIISAVDIIKGIGVSAGLEVVNVPGATGYLDTNYEGKADAALSSLEKHDFVYVHIESPDESGHEKNIEHKVKAIEDLDKRVIGRLLDNLKGDYVIGVLPDHATPISVGTHTDDPVPFAIYSSKNKSEKTGVKYTEENAKNGVLGLKDASEFMTLLIKAGNE